MGDWRHRARCRDTNPELFFPVSTTGRKNRRQIEQAKAVCNRCPVANECLNWAFENSLDGIFGGTTEDERRSMRRQTKAKR